MKNYSSVIEQILRLKSDMRTPRRFEVEHNDYHHNRLQPTDIDIITETLGNRDKFEFAYELFCRTLLAQIIHSSHRGYFRPFDYDRSIGANKYEFVEVVGWCPSRCSRHISPLVVPLFVLYWDPEETYNFAGSDHPSINDANRVFEDLFDELSEYKIRFCQRMPELLEYIVTPDTPESEKDRIVNHFMGFEVLLH